ncbi:cytochrome c biogenesis protein CcdA [Actinomyces sp. zg-332]|uniref:cytochrome c biogenesis CcdA family protein n=1 Tax=Actinomyces sp. zg-332 TaxID=2708340 RepID=UPI00142417C9|nr:cytochrome c biogenesis CcdA family protein [Actinomyces sp. zg-332]QPK94114.1 cytochrome c biogenesis protein CcdA [Actinomyces sp. zg-332]
MFEINFAIAYVGGLLTLLAPCSAMLLPAFFAYAFNSSKQLLSRTLVFYLGLISGLVPLGALAGELGGLFKIYFPTISMVVAALIILIGFMQVFSIKVPLPKLGLSAKISAKNKNSSSVFGVFLLGFGYAVIGGGCSGPILGAVLGSAIITGSVVTGIVMMLIYGFGMVTPVALMALFWDVLRINERKLLQPKPVKLFGRNTTVGNIISGGIFIILGLLFLFIPSFNITGIDASSYGDIESSAAFVGSVIPNWIFVLVIIILPIVLALLVRELMKKR